MATDREVLSKEFYDISGPNVVREEHKDHPKDVADKFVKFLESEGYKVECIYSDNIPTILYRITSPGPSHVRSTTD